MDVNKPLTGMLTGAYTSPNPKQPVSLQELQAEFAEVAGMAKEAQQMFAKYARANFIQPQSVRDDIIWQASKGQMNPVQKDMVDSSLSAKLSDAQKTQVFELLSTSRIKEPQVAQIVDLIKTVAEKPFNEGQIIRLTDGLKQNPELTLGKRDVLLQALAQDTLPAGQNESLVKSLTRETGLDNELYLQQRANRPRYQLLYLKEIGKDLKAGVVNWSKTLFQKVAKFRLRRKTKTPSE